MGTRGMIGVRINGNTYGTYNHFDSYPSGGLGEDIVNFCRDHLNTPTKVDEFASKFGCLKVVGDSKDVTPTKEEVIYYASKGELELGVDRARVEYYALLRAYQGIKGLKAILSGELKHWLDGSEFINDSLFCEYAYIMDLDRKVLEFYVGFQHSGKMQTITRRDGSTYTCEKFDPCLKLGEIAFSDANVRSMMLLYQPSWADEDEVDLLEEEDN